MLVTGSDGWPIPFTAVYFPNFSSYHWEMADLSPALRYLFIFAPIVLLLFGCWFLWYSTWKSRGTPNILRRSAIIAIFMPLGHLAYHMLMSIWIWASLVTHEGRMLRDFVGIAQGGGFYFSSSYAVTTLTLGEVMRPFYNFQQSLWWIVFTIAFAIPFLSILLNVRKYDKSIKLMRALMFWRSPQEVTVSRLEPSPVMSNSASIEHTQFCSNCGHKSSQNGKFCGKCGQMIR